MSQAPPPPSRAKTALVVALILLPLLLTIVVKYMPAVREHEKVSAVAIVHPRLYVPKEYMYLDDDVIKRLHDELAGMNGIRLQETPPENMTQIGDDLAKAAHDVGADALVVSTVTIDGGLVQFNVQLVDPNNKRILYNTPYQSSLDRYPEMIRAAGAGLKRALQQ